MCRLGSDAPVLALGMAILLFRRRDAISYSPSSNPDSKALEIIHLGEMGAGVRKKYNGRSRKKHRVHSVYPHLHYVASTRIGTKFNRNIRAWEFNHRHELCGWIKKIQENKTARERVFSEFFFSAEQGVGGACLAATAKKGYSRCKMLLVAVCRKTTPNRMEISQTIRMIRLQRSLRGGIGAPNHLAIWTRFWLKNLWKDVLYFLLAERAANPLRIISALYMRMRSSFDV